MFKPKSMHTVVIILLSLAFQVTVLAQNEIKNDDESQKFNFWIGEWDVFKNDTLKAGDSRIERILQDAVILENYSTPTGYEGKSFNFFDKEKNKWVEFWVDKNAQSILFEGNYDERSKGNCLLSYDKNTGDKPYIRKLRFFDIDSNTVRQFSERTYDDGKTWHTEYDILYKRKVK